MVTEETRRGPRVSTGYRHPPFPLLIKYQWRVILTRLVVLCRACNAWDGAAKKEDALATDGSDALNRLGWARAAAVFGKEADVHCLRLGRAKRNREIIVARLMLSRDRCQNSKSIGRQAARVGRKRFVSNESSIIHFWLLTVARFDELGCPHSSFRLTTKKRDSSN